MLLQFVQGVVLYFDLLYAVKKTMYPVSRNFPSNFSLNLSMVKGMEIL